MLNVPIHEMMESRVITVGEGERLTVAEETMRRNGIRHLPVIDAEGRLVGLFTQRDLLRILPSRLREQDPLDLGILGNYLLKEVMSRNVATLSPNNTLSEAVTLMWNKKYGCVPIVDEGRRVVGILTAIDILHFAVHFLK